MHAIVNARRFPPTVKSSDHDTGMEILGRNGRGGFEVDFRLLVASSSSRISFSMSLSTRSTVL